MENKNIYIAAGVLFVGLCAAAYWYFSKKNNKAEAKKQTEDVKQITQQLKQIETGGSKTLQTTTQAQNMPTMPDLIVNETPLTREQRIEDLVNFVKTDNYKNLLRNKGIGSDLVKNGSRAAEYLQKTYERVAFEDIRVLPLEFFDNERAVLDRAIESLNNMQIKTQVQNKSESKLMEQIVKQDLFTALGIDLLYGVVGDATLKAKLTERRKEVLDFCNKYKAASQTASTLLKRQFKI